MAQKVRAAVFPVAGRGTRFLPATKASPKEMLPIVDKPLIQYAVEEAIDAGATKLVFVTGSSKRAIEDHFDTDPELENALTESGKDELLRSIRDIVPSGVSCIYIRQGKPLGLGHAVLCARPAVGNEPFFVHLADDLIAGSPGCLTQMAARHAEHSGSVVAVETVPRESTSSYGIVAVNESDKNRITQIVEKPQPEDAPSNSAVVGRYLLGARNLRQAREYWQRGGWRNSAHRWNRCDYWISRLCTRIRSLVCATTAAANLVICKRQLPTA